MKLFRSLKMFVCIALAAVLVLSSAVLLSGCESGDTGASEPTAAAIATDASEDSGISADDQTASGSAESADSQAGGEDADADSYISKEDALAEVKMMAGSGAEIVSAEKGYTPDGLPAWIVTVIPITKSAQPVSVIYYAGYQFCYTDDEPDVYQPEEETEQEEEETADVYISEGKAIANVKKQAGSGAVIVSTEKGYTPDGLAAWIVTVVPVTTSDGAETVTYYSGDQFCYKAE